ncbi:MAG: DEAD/DEAH box helicase [Planctomycetes bacterium]|nr:DEAD/DEAH box helicase [Planctomycetota bacterium]
MQSAPHPSTTPEPFAAVPTPLREAMVERGFTELTAVQLAVSAAVEPARDLRISSQTGSGKTVALGLALAPALLSRDGARDRPGPSAVVVVPTRELAAQVTAELSWLFGRIRDVTVDCVTGGTHVGQERRRLARRPAVLVGTPGRLVDHLGSGALSVSGVGQLVLDEADQMLDMGFRDELEAILAAVPVDRRTHMLSATFPPGVRELADRFQVDPVHVEGTRLGAANTDIAHLGHVVRPNDRYAALVNLLLLAGDDRTLVFVAKRSDAAELAERLAGEGFAAMPLSGELAQAQRTRTLAAFRSGVTRVLIATDVAARGLDVPEVSTVIQVDMPMDSEVYTHRSGRTGRAGRKGHSILLCSPNAQRRAQRIFDQAGVAATWRSVPSARSVQDALTARALVRSQQRIDAAQCSDAELASARVLLDGRDPARVVAALLADRGAQGACKPRDVAQAPERSGPSGAPRPRKSRDPRPTDRGFTDRAFTDRGFTRFRVNWGSRAGANPRRLLAALCRRGGISSQEIGAIEIADWSSTFDVSNAAANEFERCAAKPDSRDPNQRIERFRERASGPRRRAPVSRQQSHGSF